MNVVITGGTKGIGLGMAREFLKRGHNVTIASRGKAAVDKALVELKQEAPDRIVAGTTCDVANYEQVEILWNTGANAMGSVDIWVNNAGRDGIKKPFEELPWDDYKKTIETNLFGLMNGNRVAIPAMKAQTRGGTIWNMEGFGSDGRILPTLGVYGSTKYALRYFTKSLVRECKDSNVKICYLSPGMVVTDLLVPPPEERGAQWEKSKKILNILADTVETVTPFLVEGMLAAKENGDAVRWLTTPKIMGRFLMATFKKRDLFGPLGI
jgi:NAD(P)-dependent dehydrogenase (short-subunit alcohol dehydrogenase family)